MSDDANKRSSLLKQMQSLFFDIATDDVLIYSDAIIGRLEHRGADHLVVRVDVNKGRLLVQLNGETLQVLPLNGRVDAACHEAFRLYFRTLNRLLHPELQEAAAA